MSVLLAEGDLHDLATATSLGLTCRSFYGILKCLHPTPIPLIHWTENRLMKKPEPKLLLAAVAEFLGSRYRGAWISPSPFRGQIRYHFLNKDTYGETRGSAQDRLNDRIVCYQLIEGFRKRYQVILKLIRPNGEGDEWYAEMLTLLDNLDMRPWTKDAKNFWTKFLAPAISQCVGSEMVMAAWSEWIVMVGL